MALSMALVFNDPKTCYYIYLDSSRNPSMVVNKLILAHWSRAMPEKESMLPISITLEPTPQHTTATRMKSKSRGNSKAQPCLSW